MRYLLLVVFASMVTNARGQNELIGRVFPSMDVETINDLKIKLPDSATGKFTLLGLAYSKKAEEELVTWFEPIFNKFITKPQGLMKGFTHDVNVFFIPMFTGINAAGAGIAKRKALKKTDPQLLPYILFYKGQLKHYKESLNFDTKESPYFFVLDPKGKIVYATLGVFTDDKLDEIESVLE
jgi:hypothetical protein